MTPAPTTLTVGHWQRYLHDLTVFAADPIPLETQGTLVRVAGLVLEAAGIRVPVGSVCEVRMAGQPPVFAEVVGFNGDRAYLMPTGDVHGLASGARVIPRPTPVVPMKLGAAVHPWRRGEDRTLHLPVGDGLLGRVRRSGRRLSRRPRCNAPSCPAAPTCRRRCRRTGRCAGRGRS